MAVNPRKSEPMYPAVDEAIKAKGSVMQFVRWASIGMVTYYHMQDGSSQPTKFVIDRILDYTGLTYEEAFRAKK